jgi:hypothetical protein
MSDLSESHILRTSHFLMAVAMCRMSKLVYFAHAALVLNRSSANNRDQLHTRPGAFELTPVHHRAVSGTETFGPCIQEAVLQPYR